MGKISTNSTVTVNYTGKLEDGSIFDTSLQEGREPLKATLGQGSLIPGFEMGLLETEVGDKKTITIDYNNAYGEYNDDMIVEVPKNQVPEGVQVGAMLQTFGPNGPAIVKVVEVNEENIKIDANHPLAGKNLIFELEVLEVE